MLASVDTRAPTCGGLCGRNSQPAAKSIGKIVWNVGGGEEYASIVGSNGAADISQWLTDDESDANNSTGLIRTSFPKLAGKFTIAITVRTPTSSATSTS
jgi:hypothetical protein